jgi:hypothetical protein
MSASKVPDSPVSRVSGVLVEFTTGAVAPQPDNRSPPKTRRTGSQSEERNFVFTGVDRVISVK